MSTQTISRRAPLAGALPALRGWAARHREQIWVVALLLLAALAHGVNMFSFPYYESDEGTYMSQAYAVAHLGKLAPYTYWYDHAPAGWLQIAAWSTLTGGFHTFGGAINSGRVLMLIMQVAATLMVYLITRAALAAPEGRPPQRWLLKITPEGCPPEGRPPQHTRLQAAPAVMAASLAALAFASSAYGLYYHRRVLLDNIAAFWMLLSIVLLVHGRLSLSRVWASALALGVSILSKELTVFLAPVIAYLVWQRSHPSQRSLATVGWIMITGSIVSLYVLMASLKGELFPSGTWLGGDQAHVSLIETLRFHSSRGNDGGLLELGSNFWTAVAGWVEAEPLLVVVGTAAMAGCILALPWRRSIGALGLATLMLWLFLGRGGIVFEFYLVPLLPLLAINLGLIAGIASGGARSGLLHLTEAGPSHTLAAIFLPRSSRRARRLDESVQMQKLRELRGYHLRPVRRLARIADGRPHPLPRLAWLAALWLIVPLAALAGSAALSVRSFLGPTYGILERPLALWDMPQADVQQLAVAWAQEHIPASSRMVIDQAMWLDLRDEAGGGRAFPNAHYYWKVDQDIEIRDDVFAGERDSADYIITTPQLRKDVRNSDLPLVAEILVHSSLVRRFDTSGWPVEVRQVHRLYPGAPTSAVLERSWGTYKARFISDGRVTDPGRGGDTTSEGQAYALLRAAYINDRAAFDQIWGWTRANLQRPDGVFAWLYGARDGSGPAVIDAGTAADGDQDIALALLLASRRWSEPAYQGEALKILGGIWEQETAVVGGQVVLVAGSWARGGEGRRPVVNPSYFAPYAYRIFQQADPSRPWESLVGSSYAILESFTHDDRLGARTGLVPTWVALDPATGAPALAEGLDDADAFGYDGLRAPWRLTLDWLWYRDERARQALLRFRGLGESFRRDGKIAAAYDMDGAPREGYESVAMYAGAVPALLFSGDPGAWQAFDQGLQARYHDDGEQAYWGDPDNYYDQNWAWLSTALLDGAMGNLWEGQERLDWSGVIID